MEQSAAFPDASAAAVSGDLLDGYPFVKLLAQDALNPLLDRHRGVRASPAGTFEPQADVESLDGHYIHVATIGL